MLWIAPSEKDTTTGTLEKRLRDSADQFRANSGPILGIIFLRFAEVRFTQQRAQLEPASSLGGERRGGGPGLQRVGPVPSPGAPRASRRGSRVDQTEAREELAADFSATHLALMSRVFRLLVQRRLSAGVRVTPGVAVDRTLMVLTRL